MFRDHKHDGCDLIKSYQYVYTVVVLIYSAGKSTKSTNKTGTII